MKNKIEQLRKQAERLEDEAHDLASQALIIEQQEQQRMVENYRNYQDIDIFQSSDYAVMNSGELQFYFGYEETFCPKHGKKDCGDYEEGNEKECDKGEWAFVAKDGKKELMRVPQSKLYPVAGETCLFYLIAGIALYLKRKKNDKKRTKNI